MARNVQTSAIEAVVLSELEKKDFQTVGCDGLEFYGLPPEHIEVIRNLIEKEKKKPAKDRRVNLVMTEFNIRGSNPKNAQPFFNGKSGKKAKRKPGSAGFQKSLLGACKKGRPK